MAYAHFLRYFKATVDQVFRFLNSIRFKKKVNDDINNNKFY